MEDVEEKLTSESSSRNAEAMPQTETCDENNDMITPANASDSQSITQDEYILIDNSASFPKDTAHGLDQDEYILIDNPVSSPKDIVHQGALAEDPEPVALEDSFQRQHEGYSTVTGSGDVDNLMKLSTSSSTTKDLQIETKEQITDPSPTNVVDVPVESLASNPNDVVHVIDQSQQEVVATDLGSSALEDILNRKEDGESIVRADSGVDNQMEILASEKKGSQNDKNELKIDLPQTKATDIAVVAVDPHTIAKQIAADRTIIDTAAPFESVKEAVSKFGEIMNWKPPRKQTVERRKEVEQELEKANEEIPQYQKRSEAVEEAKVQVLQELDSKKRLIEELKLNLERAQIEERQSKQDSELAKLRVEEMVQGVAEDSSVAAKAQLEVAKARYTTAITELVSVKEDTEKLRKEYTTAVTERDKVMKKAEDAVAALKQVEKTMEDLTIEFIGTKESFETAHAAHMEAEEHRIGKDQDLLNLEKELKQVEAELERLKQKILSVKDLKSKLSKASTLLLDLRAELNSHMESNKNQKGDEKGELEQQENETHNEIQDAVASAKMELEEVKLKIEKVIAEVDYLKVAATTLRSELEQEKLSLASLRQRQQMNTIIIEELDKTRPEIVLVKAAEEANQANLLAQAAREEQQRVKEEAKQAKDIASTMQSRLLAVQKEIEAAKASERLAIAAIKALQESELARSKNEVVSVKGVILSVEEYYQLSKQAHEAEEKANVTVATTNSDIEIAKESELKALEKLNDVNKEMAARRKSLKIAMDKAETSRDGQLGVIEQLRKLRAEGEQRRKTGEIGEQVVDQNSSQSVSFDSCKETNNGTGSSLDAKGGKKKKKMRTLYKLSLTMNYKSCKN